MSLSVEVLTSPAQIAGLRQQWNQLLTERDPASPFETCDWLVANLNTFGDSGLQVVTFRTTDGGLAGVLPLKVREGRKYLRTRQWLEFAGLPFADYGASVIRRGFEAEAANAFMPALLAQKECWDGIYLDGLRKNDQFAICLQRAAGHLGLFNRLEPTYRIHRLTNAGELQKSGTRSKVQRHLSKKGNVSFEVVNDAELIARQLDGYFRMHIARCTAKRAVCPLADAAQQRFFRNVVSVCAPAGQVWLSTLRCDAVAIASRFSLRYGEALHLYSTCFAPEFAKYSPSMLQLNALLEYAFSHGIRVVDFGVGDSPHKAKVGADQQIDLMRLEVYRSHAAYLESRMQSAAKEAAKHSRLVRAAGKGIRKWLPFGTQQNVSVAAASRK